MQTSLPFGRLDIAFTISHSSVTQPPENLMLLAVRGLAEPNQGLRNFETTFHLLIKFTKIHRFLAF